MILDKLRRKMIMPALQKAGLTWLDGQPTAASQGAMIVIYSPDSDRLCKDECSHLHRLPEIIELEEPAVFDQRCFDTDLAQCESSLFIFCELLQQLY